MYKVLIAIAAMLSLQATSFALGAKVHLLLDQKSVNHLKVKELGRGEYEITTTGNDPFVLTNQLTQAYDHNAVSVLSFETFALKEIDGVQIFFSPPLAETHSVSGLTIESSEGWMPFTANLGQSKKWGKGKMRFRIDFGKTPGITLRIRNLHLRKMTGQEIRELQKSVAEKKRDKANKDATTESLASYFAASYPNRIRAVSAEKSAITVQYEASEGLMLAEVRPWQQVQLLTKLEELTWFKPLVSGKGTIKIPRVVKGVQPYDRIYSSWCLVQIKKKAIQLMSHALYCIDDAKAVVKTIPVPKPKTKKGLQISWRPNNMKQLDELGVKHAAVNIELCALLNVSKGVPYIEHAYMGKTFRINKNVVERQSKVLSYAAKNKYLMGAILLISKHAPKEYKSILHHPDYDPRGIYSMANVTSREGVFYYAMLTNFLASYFSTEEHGYIHYYIIHNEVDAAWVWTNCGKNPAEIMMDYYVKSMRVVYNTVRQYNPQSRVMISLTHFWNKRNTHGPADAMYAPKNLLNILADHSRVEGDFDWGLAYHPYPHDLRNPQVWKDPVHWRFDTDIISYKNLEVLVAYMKQSKFFYKGKRRKIHLTEQGFSNPNDSNKQLQMQAAAMAYGMKKVNGLEGIDAHILHRWVDHAKEGGLNLGLVQKKSGSICTVGKKKPSFDVYAAIGTPQEDEVCRFALKLIGIKSWDEIFYRTEIR